RRAGRPGGRPGRGAGRAAQCPSSPGRAAPDCVRFAGRARVGRSTHHAPAAGATPAAALRGQRAAGLPVSPVAAVPWGVAKVNSREPFSARGASMANSLLRYTFPSHVPMDEVEATLLLAIWGAEGLHGESQVRLDAAHLLDRDRRACLIDAGTPVGQDV